MQLVRCAFDPAGTFNPGKMFPHAAALRRQAGALPAAPQRGRGRSVARRDARVDRGSAGAASRRGDGRGLIRRRRDGAASGARPSIWRSPRRSWTGLIRVRAPPIRWLMVECGMRLATLQRELAKHGQRLALDPLQPDKATLGGIIVCRATRSVRSGTAFGVRSRNLIHRSVA